MLTLHGSIWAEPGVWTWLNGAGRCSFAGVGDQTVDLAEMAGTLDLIYINKPSGRLVLQSDLQSSSLDHRAGILDPGGRSITTLGDCRIQVGAKLAEPLDGSAYDDQPYADVKDGDTGLLEAGEGGAAQVLWKESGAGSMWAVVRLGTPWYPIVEGTLDAIVLAAGSTTVSIAGTTRDLSAVMPASPGNGKKWASGSTVFCGWTGAAWKIISIVDCPVDAS